jgi:hypothetical protein
VGRRFTFIRTPWPGGTRSHSCRAISDLGLGFRDCRFESRLRRICLYLSCIVLLVHLKLKYVCVPNFKNIKPHEMEGKKRKRKDVVSTSASYWGDSRFESLPGDQLC